MHSERLIKLSLRVLMVSVAAMVALGLYALAIPSDSWFFELKALGTTLIVTAASIAGLACGGCMGRGHRVLPGIGLVLTPIAAILLLVGLWAEIKLEWYWKIAVTVSCYAVAAAHLSMLFMARLAGPYRWAYVVAYQLIFGLATLFAAGVLFELFDGDRYWRATASISVLVAAITLLIPVFHHMSREVAAVERGKADLLFAVDEEIAQLKKRLMELEAKRRVLLASESAP